MPQNPQHALERQRIRAEIREHRRLLTPVQQQQSAHLAAQHIAEHPKIQQAHTVAVFLSFDGELDTQPIIEQLWQQKNRFICLSSTRLAPVIYYFCAIAQKAR